MYKFGNFLPFPRMVIKDGRIIGSGSRFETLFPETKKSFAEKCFGLEKQFMEKQKKVSRNFVSRMVYLSFLCIMPGNPI